MSNESSDEENGTVYLKFINLIGDLKVQYIFTRLYIALFLHVALNNLIKNLMKGPNEMKLQEPKGWDYCAMNDE